MARAAQLRGRRLAGPRSCWRSAWPRAARRRLLARRVLPRQRGLGRPARGSHLARPRLQRLPPVLPAVRSVSFPRILIGVEEFSR